MSKRGKKIQPAAGSESADLELLRAAGGGDEQAFGRLFDAHCDRLHGLLRLVLPARAEAEAVLSRTFAEAVERAGRGGARSLPAGVTGVADWLASIAIEQVARTVQAHAGERQPAGINPVFSPLLGTGELQHVSDTSLMVLIQRLELQRRQALVLGLLWRLGDEQLGRTLGISQGEACALREEALAGLRDQLALHYERDRSKRSAALTAKLPIHLRGLPAPGPDGIVTIRGMRAYFGPPPSDNLFAVMMRAIDRFIEWLRRRHAEEFEDDRDLSLTKRAKSPEPTPGMKPFKKPKPTPSMKDYKLPEPTRGTQLHRTPKETPSTARLSNPRRPSPSGTANARAQRSKW